jgi:hypothetical protein
MEAQVGVVPGPDIRTRFLSMDGTVLCEPALGALEGRRAGPCCPMAQAGQRRRDHIPNPAEKIEIPLNWTGD